MRWLHIMSVFVVLSFASWARAMPDVVHLDLGSSFPVNPVRFEGVGSENSLDWGHLFDGFFGGFGTLAYDSRGYWAVDLRTTDVALAVVSRGIYISYGDAVWPPENPFDLHLAEGDAGQWQIPTVVPEPGAVAMILPFLCCLRHFRRSQAGSSRRL
jgi:hypothetical protein